MKPLLCLSMILRDEAATIAATLATVRDHVDSWVIADTGSTDGTADIVREAMRGVPGLVIDLPFVDFAATRNAALEWARERAEYVLWLDADDELDGGQALRDHLRAAPCEACDVTIDMGFTFSSPRVLRSSSAFRFQGAVHEVLVHPDGIGPAAAPDGVRIRHTAAGADRSRARWERDLVLLRAACDADPTDARSAFYLANTLLWLGRYEDAIPAFARRIALGGWREEVYQSAYEVGQCLQALGRGDDEVLPAYERAHTLAPHRAEPAFALALRDYARERWVTCHAWALTAARLPVPATDRLWVDRDVYVWRAADLVAVSAWALGRYADGYPYAVQAARARPLDSRLRANLAAYERQRARLPGTPATQSTVATG